MRVLVIEDNKRTASLVKEGLVHNRYAVDVCYDYDSGLGAAIDPDYDIVLIDRMLPNDKDGLDICKQLRNSKIDTPVIMITAQGEINDKVEGLRQGADDYIVKPFSIKELVARIQAISRRPKTFKGLKLEIDDLTIDNTAHKVFRGNTEIHLTPKEYSILHILVQNKNVPLSKDYIISHVWDGDADVLPSGIETYINGIRKKVELAFPNKPQLIKTIWGVGYKVSDVDNV